jgi:hypothetical protein
LTATAKRLRAAATAATAKAVKAEAAAKAAVGTKTAAAKAATAKRLRAAAIAATAKAVKAEAAVVAAGGTIPKGFAGTSGGTTTGGTTKWLLISRNSGAVVQYDKTTTPPTWSLILPPMPLQGGPALLMKYGEWYSPVSMGNMLIEMMGRYIFVYDLTTKTFSERSKNTQNDTSFSGVSAYSAYGDIWTVSMGNMLIGGLRGHVTIYDSVNDVWSPAVQAPTLAFTSNDDFWSCVMGRMIISPKGMTSIYTPGANGSYGTWSPAVQGPDGLGWWMSFGSNMVLSRGGMGSIYTASSGSWSTPVRMLPELTGDEWGNVVDDMVISWSGIVYKYNTNQTFTQIQNVPLPNLLSGNRGWYPAMKLN